MANIVINGTTYESVEAVELNDSNGNPVQYFPDAVRYVAQDLTDEQKAQARQNLGIEESGPVETNLYDPTQNTERSKYDNSGEVVSEYGWYRTSDMNLNGKKSFLYGGLGKTAAAETVRSVFKDAEGNVVSVFLPLTGENKMQVPNGATFVSFTLHMNDVATFYAKIVTSTGIADTVIEGWHAKLGERLNCLLQKATQKKICCIVDDDTADTDSVNLFKAACDANDIKGTLASLTYNWTKDTSLKDTLLSMERDGFQIVIHAYAQNDYWNDPETNAADCESNLVHGMQDMQSAGFTDYKYWVTPYCKDTDCIQRMARKWGMKCALAGGNTYEPADDTYGRYALRRAAFGVDDSSSSITFDQLKAIAQDAANSNGWLIVMTHFETWKQASVGSGNDYTRFTDLVNYLKGLGYEFMTVADAFSYRKAIYDVYDVF